MKFSPIAVAIVAVGLLSNLAKAEVPCPYHPNDPDSNDQQPTVSLIDHGQKRTLPVCVLLDDAQRPGVLSALKTSGNELVAFGGTYDWVIDYFAKNEDALADLSRRIDQEQESLDTDDRTSDPNYLAEMSAHITKVNKSIQSMEVQLKSAENAFGDIYCGALGAMNPIGQGPYYSGTVQNYEKGPNKYVGCSMNPNMND